ncbi:MAG: thioester reductase domain-containing protein, partial [Deltaproteobacteria bacterium]|nr:thioester reductase domain-containing protein [Deltaproteobacteria bacterium]
EATAEASHPALRSGCSAAVSVEIDGEEKLVVFCELERRYRKSQEHFDIQRRRDGENPDVVETSIDEKPDPRRILGLIHESISRNHEVQAHYVVLLKPRSIPKTSSGKIQRHACRAEYLEGELDIIDQWLKPATGKRADSAVNDDGKGPPQIVEAWLLSRIREKLSLEQDIDTRASLASYGIDSLSALEFAQDIEAKFSVEVPIGLLFESRSIAEVLVSIEALIRSRDGATGPIPLDLAAQVLLDPEINVHPTNLRTPAEANSIFLTGATGFLGAYLLKELMEKTEARIFCLVRAENATAGFQRLRENLSFYSLWRDSWESRIVAVPGHLSSPRLGLSEADFTALAGEIDVIYHNGALVNFIYSYQDLQAANVSGTREILRLACLAKTKPVHYVSTLSVFRPDGDPQGRAFEESDALENGSGLLNGYAESKWVAEKTLALARERGLPISIYRVGEVVGDGGGGLMKSSQDANSLLLKGCVDMGCAPRLSFQWYYVPVDYATGAIVHLSMKPASSGKNFHITNPERISSSQVFRSLSALGYEVEEIPYSAWMERVSDFLKKTPRHPLAALMPFLKKPAVRNLGEAQGNLKIDCQATVMAIDDPGIQCPKPEALLGQFLTQLVANGFLGKPTGTRGRIEIVAPSVSGSDPIFEPLRFRNLTIKNRIVRSSISGRIDNYDGSGTQARVNWEERFARGGVGAIISAHVPVQLRGRILPNYAFIDRDDTIPFWREVGEAVHRHDCKFIMQLAHSGRQQDVAGVENRGHMSLSSSSGVDTFHGLESRAMTQREIHDVIGYFAAAARRAREAGLDGIELHAANGYLFTQFMSSAINKRKDEWGGSLENRARFLLEVVKAIRAEVGRDFHLQAKISAVDHSNALMFWEKKGNTLEESVEICRWLEAAGVDAIHVSTGNMFPHPRNPAGPLPQREAADYYPIMLKSGKHTFRNYLFFKFKPLYAMFNYLWSRTIPKQIEGLNLADSRAIKQAVGIPVLCTGGFQTASLIRNAIRGQGCDAVTIARPLMANVDLPKIFAAGRDKPEKPCTYCNKCLANVLENPLGCYEVSRFGGDQERMMEELMSFYKANPEQTEAVPEELEKVAGSRTLA